MAKIYLCQREFQYLGTVNFKYKYMYIIQAK